MFNPQNDVLLKKHFLIIFFSVLSILFFIVVAEQNMGQFAMYLRSKVEGVHFNQFNQVKGQPFVVNELVEAFTNLLKA